MVVTAYSLTAQTSSPTKVDFLRDIEPLLSQKCYSCHGPQVQQSGLRLDRRQAALRGGDYGPVIVPGRSADSKFIRRLVNGDGGMIMPPTGALSPEEIQLLRTWIDQGAEYRLDVKAEAPAKPVDPKLQALITAIRGHNSTAVTAALKANPELLNAKDQAGSTPLHHAAGFGSLEILQQLLAKGADPQAKNRRKSTPLHWAIHDLAKVRVLIAKGADVNAQQAEGRSPLFLAAMLGDGLATVRHLLQSGAAADSKTVNGQTPLHAAAARGHAEVVRLLLPAGVNRQAGNGSTPLIATAASGSAETVRLLLDSGADPNLRDRKKESALAEAATSGNAESVRLLLAKGAEVRVVDDRGYSPLMYAAASERIPADIVRMLLANGADKAVTGEGETAATLAAKRGNTEVAQLLGAADPHAAVAAKKIRAAPISIPEAVSKAMSLLEKQSANFIRIGGCNSCHAQDLPSAAAAIAKDHGIAVPPAIPQLPASMGPAPERVIDFGVISAGSVAWELFDYGSNRVRPDAYTDAVVRYLKAMQQADGRWGAPESRRPPMSAGELQVTALSIYALRHYTPAPEKAGTATSIARAAAWLAMANPENTQDRAFQLMGLFWAAAAKPEEFPRRTSTVIDRAATDLLAMQKPDGGWSQLPAMPSDAYATGQALYALSLTGQSTVRTTAFRKGVQYLLRSQAQDGSWHVRSRSIWFQPYFESGFPYGHDQWISAAGTAWASMALAMAHEPATLRAATAP
jgi:ankyrin repeat protein